MQRKLQRVRSVIHDSMLEIVRIITNRGKNKQGSYNVTQRVTRGRPRQIDQREQDAIDLVVRGIPRGVTRVDREGDLNNLIPQVRTLVDRLINELVQVEGLDKDSALQLVSQVMNYLGMPLNSLSSAGRRLTAPLLNAMVAQEQYLRHTAMMLRDDRMVNMIRPSINQIFRSVPPVIDIVRQEPAPKRKDPPQLLGPGRKLMKTGPQSTVQKQIKKPVAPPGPPRRVQSEKQRSERQKQDRSRARQDDVQGPHKVPRWSQEASSVYSQGGVTMIKARYVVLLNTRDRNEEEEEEFQAMREYYEMAIGIKDSDFQKRLRTLRQSKTLTQLQMIEKNQLEVYYRWITLGDNEQHIRFRDARTSQVNRGNASVSRRVRDLGLRLQPPADREEAVRNAAMVARLKAGESDVIESVLTVFPGLIQKVIKLVTSQNYSIPQILSGVYRQYGPVPQPVLYWLFSTATYRDIVLSRNMFRQLTSAELQSTNQELFQRQARWGGSTIEASTQWIQVLDLQRLILRQLSRVTEYPPSMEAAERAEVNLELEQRARSWGQFIHRFTPQMRQFIFRVVHGGWQYALYNQFLSHSSRQYNRMSNEQLAETFERATQNFHSNNPQEEAFQYFNLSLHLQQSDARQRQARRRMIRQTFELIDKISPPELRLHVEQEVKKDWLYYRDLQQFLATQQNVRDHAPGTHTQQVAKGRLTEELANYFPSFLGRPVGLTMEEMQEWRQHERTRPDFRYRTRQVEDFRRQAAIGGPRIPGVVSIPRAGVLGPRGSVANLLLVPNLEIPLDSRIYRVQSSEIVIENQMNLALNIMSLSRQLMYRAWKVVKLAEKSREPVPQEMNGAFNFNMVTNQAYASDAMFIMVQFNILPVDPSLRATGVYLAVFARRIIQQLKTNFNKLIVEKYDGSHQIFDITSVTLKTQFFRQWVRLGPPPITFNVQQRTFRYLRYMGGSKPPMTARASWNVQTPDSPEFTQFSRTHPPPAQCRRHCLYHTVAFFAGALWAADHMRQINQGQFQVLVQLLAVRHEFGVVRFASPVLSVLRQGSPQIYIQPRHCGIVTYKQARKMVGRQHSDAQRVFDLGHFGRRAGNYHLDVRTNRSRAYSHALSAQIPTFYVTKDLQTYTISQQFRKNVLFWDIQCLSVQEAAQPCYLSTILGWVGFQYVQYIHTGYNIFENPLFLFMQLLLQLNRIAVQSQSTITIWTYGGFHYEMKYLNILLTQHFGEVRSLGAKGETKSIIAGSLVFRDAILLYSSGSLSQNSKTYNQHYLKQDLDIGMVDTYALWRKNMDAIIRYNVYDCLALFQLVEKFYCRLYILGRDITPRDQQYRLFSDTSTLLSKFTCPSISLYFFNRYFAQAQGQIVNDESLQMYGVQRQNYMGGMVEVHRLYNQAGRTVTYLDVNSMYPYFLASPCLPVFYWGEVLSQGQTMTKTIQQGQFVPQDAWFFRLTDVTFGRIPPFIPVKTSKGLAYPSQIRQCWVWGRSVRVLNSFGGRYRIRVAHQYASQSRALRQCTSFRRYVHYMYQKKSTSQDKTMRNMFKLFINSLYGKMTQRQQALHFYYEGGIDYQQKIQQNIPAQRFMGMSTGPMQHLMVGSNATGGVGRFVRIGAYITDSARSYLAQMGAMVGSDNVLYNDTDSIVLYSDVVPVLRQYMDRQGSQQLGKFKIENMSGGIGVFDRCLFLSRKCYLLHRRSDNVIIIKAKGINWKGSAQQNMQLFDMLDTFVRRMVLQGIDQSTDLFRKIDTQIEVQCRRWISSRAQDSNVIQRYYKKININFKRVLGLGGQLTAPTWQQVVR